LSFQVLHERFSRWIKTPTTSLLLGTLADLTRGKSELLAENALLRQQLIILRRQIKRPVYRKTDRFLLVVLARMVRSWKQALLLVQPETLLRWHRELSRVFWKHKSKAPPSKQRLSSETISLIKEMAANNRFWGAERIRGELLKLDIRVSKRTIQKYMRQVRPKRADGQKWKTFLHNHAAEVSGVGACDFLRFPDLFFRSLFAFIIIELKSRKVIHVNVTRSLPIFGWHNSCGRRLRMGKHQHFLFGITTGNSVRISHAWRPQVASTSFERRIERRKPMRSVNVFRGA
jgi:putative transposase